MKFERVGEGSFPQLEDLFFDGRGSVQQELVRFCAVEEVDALGGCSFSVHEDRCLLESLYVARSRRRKGVGSLLLEKAEQIASSMGLGRMEAVFNDSAEGMRRLFRKQGYRCFKGSPVYFLKAEDFFELPFLRQPASRKNLGFHIKSISNLGPREGQALSEMLKERGIPLREDVLADFSPELSSAVLDSAPSALGCVLVSHSGTDAMIDLMYSIGSHAMSAMIEAIGMTAQSLREFYERGQLKRLIVHSSGVNARDLMENFFTLGKEVLETQHTVIAEKDLENG
ncbi:MAG: GNAT family N-acetyltransferase [Lachnospiraceae bacterium]|nr:GNAT family N-acetyltransferase [Lachnospiraceae bacterium]